jgi:hypothetical protein
MRIRSRVKFRLYVWASHVFTHHLALLTSLLDPVVAVLSSVCFHMADDVSLRPKIHSCMYIQQEIQLIYRYGLTRHFT